MAFQKAVKRDAKGRVALIGSAGAGKSFTMLRLARALAGPTGTIAAIDTEHGSLSKYAHTDTCGGPGACKDPSHFEFDVDELGSFSPGNFLKSLDEAEKKNYDVFCCDSLSHFWMGKDGALEYVDNAAKRSQSKDSMAGWKDFRPHERSMIDAMIASTCHVICTMRTKTAYEEQVNERTGKKQRVKIGLAPVQREGLEFEFDLVGAMDEENTLIVDKTRCSFYSGKAITKPGPEEFAPFIEWLKGAPAESRKVQTASQPVPQSAAKPWNTFKEMLALFDEAHKLVGDEFYYATLNAAEVQQANEFRETSKALSCYAQLRAQMETMTVGSAA